MESDSKEKLVKLRNRLVDTFGCSNTDDSIFNGICIYACGSLGRFELTTDSDLDLFFINLKSIDATLLEKSLVFPQMYKINRELGYRKPSKQGMYWDFISKKDLLDIGSRHEDYNNSFTARMLLLLESQFLYNEDAYCCLIRDVIDEYFKDYKRHEENFYPLYLMNDILRYWYTLTLNYEYRRDNNDTENEKNWKRLKLKYARLLTCYSMITSLFKKNITSEYVIEKIAETPIDRLKSLKSWCAESEKIVPEILNEYEWFISLRSESSTWWTEDDNKKMAFKKADSFHHLIVHELVKTVSEENKELLWKTDFGQFGTLNYNG